MTTFQDYHWIHHWQFAHYGLIDYGDCCAVPGCVPSNKNICFKYMIFMQRYIAYGFLKGSQLSQSFRGKRVSEFWFRPLLIVLWYVAHLSWYLFFNKGLNLKSEKHFPAYECLFSCIQNLGYELLIVNEKYMFKIWKSKNMIFNFLNSYFILSGTLSYF